MLSCVDVGNDSLPPESYHTYELPLMDGLLINNASSRSPVPNHSVGSQGDFGEPSSGLFDTHNNIKFAGTLILLGSGGGESPMVRTQHGL
jgi:hypothetical protein